MPRTVSRIPNVETSDWTQTKWRDRSFLPGHSGFTSVGGGWERWCLSGPYEESQTPGIGEEESASFWHDGVIRNSREIQKYSKINSLMGPRPGLKTLRKL